VCPFDISPWSSLTDLKLDFNERDILNAAKVPEMMAKVCSVLAAAFF
jgi:hypothetical protein